MGRTSSDITSLKHNWDGCSRLGNPNVHNESITANQLPKGWVSLLTISPNGRSKDSTPPLSVEPPRQRQEERFYSTLSLWSHPANGKRKDSTPHSLCGATPRISFRKGSVEKDP